MKGKTKKIVNIVIDVFLVVAIIALSCLLFFKVNYLNVIVEGSSMNPTIENMEMGYMKKVNKNTKIERFDIVAIDIENPSALDASNNDGSTFWIKRVLGLPYETVKISTNDLYINGEIVEQAFSILGDTTRCDCEYTLKDNEYLIAGDNRVSSVLPKVVSKEQIKAKNGFMYRSCASYDFSNNVCAVKGKKEWKWLNG